MRKDDSKEKTYFRAKDRVFHINDGWWYAKREGDRGPWPSKQAAADELTAYIREVRGNVDLHEISIFDKDPDKPDVWAGRSD
jgi:hypothetical protein